VAAGVPLSPAPPPESEVQNAARHLSLSRSERPAGTLRIITWNVLFDPRDAGPRWNELFSLVVGEAPDVVCLQEVVPCFVRYLYSQSWASQYAMSDDGRGGSVAPDGELLLIGKWLMTDTCTLAFSSRDLPSDQGRKLAICQLGSFFAVGTAHFESMAGKAACRSEQVMIARSSFRHPTQLSILAGDFNCIDAEDDATMFALVDAGWTDAWDSAATKPGGDGSTYDPSKNRVAAVKGESVGRRLDRVFLKTSGGLSVCVQEAWLLGTQSMSQDGSSEQLWPSDHFGVAVDIAVQGMS